MASVTNNNSPSAALTSLLANQNIASIPQAYFSHVSDVQIEEEHSLILRDFPDIDHLSVDQRLQYFPISSLYNDHDNQRNRYKNIIANETTRVQFADEFYYNANYINAPGLPERFAVAAQGPLDKTIQDFWIMVDRLGSETIVMATGLVENGQRKCSRYWPEKPGSWLEVKPNKFMGRGPLKILFAEEKMFSGTDIKRRTFFLYDNESDRKVVQYHITGWNDRETTSASNLRQLIQYLIRERSNSPLVVHCSAGVGRTGTFLVSYSITCNLLRLQKLRREDNQGPERIQLEQKMPGMIKEILMQMRSSETGRIGLLGNAKQYKLVYEIALLVEKSIEEESQSTRSDDENNSEDLYNYISMSCRN